MCEFTLLLFWIFFQIQVIKYTFSSNYWNREKAPFLSLVKKIRAVRFMNFGQNTTQHL